jgi:hypothetical protein
MTITHEKCRHFRGQQQETCAAGVAMGPLRGRQLPCLQFSGLKPAPDTCPSRAWMTQAEHDAARAELDRRLEELRDLGARGLCRVCEKPIAPTRKIGRCLYGACGHRIGQV